MRTSILSFLLIPLVAALPSQATPRDLTEAELLEKRNTNEGVYLSNCWFYSLGDWASEMEYYSNARSGSQHGELPNDTTTLSSTSRVTWEGVQRCGYYSSSGVTFCSQIASNAASLVTGQYAGPGWNNAHGFDCYKDNGRVLFRTSSGNFNQNEECYSIYYCFSQA
ncbi:hypothetical protein QBC33DRAFT_585235 [Phialemonium atrogriseum]|uniref:Uncharacterized protein n=1 Tax=Phialemonium atrogriseum TaxID=1093897 RepID=A0AAJ0C1K1_9PEZI|nr:uncharacterized protein QBC33DRAFT_585235 [Phialemonium atrogriseum]KAK1768235.1 hypothetical protein QBC33DRAFT_585235 [Phialemonium atrogriseum]